MKTIERYECEVCGKVYEEKEEALGCEKNHKDYKPVSVRVAEDDMDVYPHYNEFDSDAFPFEVLVKFANGKEHSYILDLELDDEDEDDED